MKRRSLNLFSESLKLPDKLKNKKKVEFGTLSKKFSLSFKPYLTPLRPLARIHKLIMHTGVFFQAEIASKKFIGIQWEMTVRL